MTKLIKLEDFNNAKLLRNAKLKTRNGIECPQCKEELYDSNSGLVYLSNPKQIDVYCMNCGFKGYRFL